MDPFLASIDYDRWILPALLIVPVAGAIVILLQGTLAGSSSERLLPVPTSPGARTPGGSAPPASEVAPPDAGLVPEARVVVPVSGTTVETHDAGAAGARWVAFWILALEFVLSAGLWWSFDPASGGWQAVVDLRWIPTWNARFTVGIDGIALMMILLTTLLMPLSVLGSWTGIRRKEHAYYALLLILTTGMLGVFMSLDLLLFYVMWEVMLVPMYFIIGIWGGERRIYASLKFFIYTMLGSLLMLVAIVYLYQAGANPLTGDGSFSYDYLLTSARPGGTAPLWLFGAFFLAFAVKVPMFPFHTWLPDAHVEAPTAGSVILAGIMLKMGTFGFLRFAVPFFPDAAMHPAVRTVILVLAVIGIIYGALVAMVQPDFKKLVAYSSVSHLGFVMLGIFALTVESVQGALMVMINHGISTGALFFLIGMIYERKHSRMIDAYGGIARVVPMFAALLTFVSLSSIGLPGLNGFIGEFLVLMGAFRTTPILTMLAATGVIFAAAYLLWAIQRILFNPLDKPANARLTDLNGRELLLLAPLVAAIVWLGVYPQPVLDRMESSATQFVRMVEQRRGPIRTVTQDVR
jgi:NADH-quinone oxidoreductase subunit M